MKKGDALTSYVGRFHEVLGYDAHGNVTRVVRHGYTSNMNGLMDNLTLSYDGNRLTGVSEAAADYDMSGSFEYKGANGSQYVYDANGSLVADKSRGIAFVTYDASNNPGAIYFTNGSVTKYAYDSSGQKLRVMHHTAKPNITRTFGVMPPELTPSQTLSADTTDYLLGGSLVATNGTVDKILFDGGFADVSSSGSFVLFYYNKDHLGNNREALIRSGNVFQVTRYYPVALRRLFLAMAELKQVSLCSFGLAKKFGAQYAGSTEISGVNIQPYKYNFSIEREKRKFAFSSEREKNRPKVNGKELDRMHGLDTYDYGARQYNPVLGKWDRMDPLCEKYYSISPYAYCANNPVMCIDPDGKESMRTNGGEYYKRTGILIMAGGALMVAAGTAYSIVTSGGGTVAGGGQLFLRRHIPPRNKVLEVRKKQKADICMAKHMEVVQNRTSNHKITKGKKLMNIEIRG